MQKRMSTKSVSWYEKLLTTQMENLHVVSHFNTKHSISALCYAQVFGTTEKESLKRTTKSRWTSFSKSRIAPCLKILSCLCQLSQLYVSPICANSDKWREVVMRDWIDNFQPVWQQTIEAIQLKIKRDLHQSITGLCNAVCYLIKELQRFFASSEFQKNWSSFVI